MVPRLRRSVLARGFLDGVNVASLALMAVVTWFLGRSAISTTGRSCWRWSCGSPDPLPHQFGLAGDRRRLMGIVFGAVT